MKNIYSTLVALLFSYFLVGCNSGARYPANQASVDTHGSAFLIQNGIVVNESALNARIPLIYHSINYNGQAASITCSGTLLDAQTILTAAHCVLDMQDHKAVGENYTESSIVATNSLRVILPVNLTQAVNLNQPEQTNWNVYHVATIYVHKEALNGVAVYGSSGFNIVEKSKLNDIAILKLTTPVADQYQFAKLATSNPALGQSEIIAGFGVNQGNGVVSADHVNGASNVLRMAYASVQKIDASGFYIYVGGNSDQQQGYSKNCDGDSGGPDFIIADNGDYILTGIHSFNDGNVCGVTNLPSASLSVASYQDWIKGGYLQDSLILDSSQESSK